MWETLFLPPEDSETKKGSRVKRLRGIKKCSLRTKKKVLIMKNNHAPHKKSSSSPFFPSVEDTTMRFFLTNKKVASQIARPGSSGRFSTCEKKSKNLLRMIERQLRLPGLGFASFTFSWGFGVFMCHPSWKRRRFGSTFFSSNSTQKRSPRAQDEGKKLIGKCSAGSVQFGRSKDQHRVQSAT